MQNIHIRLAIPVIHERDKKEEEETENEARDLDKEGGGIF